MTIVKHPEASMHVSLGTFSVVLRSSIHGPPLSALLTCFLNSTTPARMSLTQKIQIKIAMLLQPVCPQEL